jgi:hypothetical protein
MFEVGDLVRIWVEDLDFRLQRKYRNNYATITKLIFDEMDEYSPSFVEVFFPSTSTTERFTYSRIRKVEGENE